ncbi:MAG: hypothetical protein OCD02_03295 [Spirochaetaceae bacterium]
MSRILFLSFVFIISISLFAQSKPIVQIDPVINLSGETWLDPVCISSTNGVSLILSLLGRFEVNRDETEVLEVLDTSILKERAETMGYDNIIFGSCTIKDEAFIITMSAYDRSLDKITYSGSTVVESIFDTFDAVDQITYELVEGFSGIHVTYGSLVLIPPVTGEPFNFTLDGVALPKGVFSIDKMPSGTHKLAVSQERPLGLYEKVHDIVVAEEVINNIAIPLPLIAGEEIPIFNRVDKELRLAAIEGKSDIDPVMDNINNLLLNPFFQQYRKGLVEKYKKWEISIKGKPAQIVESVKFKLKYSKDSLWDSSKYKGVFNNRLSLSSQYRINFNNKVDFTSNNNLLADIRTIKVDGSSDDWESVADSIIDPVGDLKSGNIKPDGKDLIEVKAAIDNKYLYLMMRTQDMKYNYPNNVYSFHIGNNPNILIHYVPYTNEFWVNKHYNDSNNKPWESIISKAKFKTGDIYELSLPLKDLLENTEMGENTDISFDVTYDGDNSGWIRVDDNGGTLLLPITQALIEKPNNIEILNK